MRDWPMATAGWFKRLFDRIPEAPAGQGEGNPALTSGGNALLALETLSSEALCRARDRSGAYASEDAVNAYGRAIDDIRGSAPRSVFAAAAGVAATGRRVAAFVPGDRLAEVHDQLFAAVGRHLPLLLHASNRAMPRQASARGSGHEGYHSVADCGAFVLMPRNVQEAVDMTLAARLLTEKALVPGIVAIDGPETTWGPQDLRLPSPATVRELLGATDDAIDAPTEAQRMVFGATRRRIPEWISAERPIAIGVAQNDDQFGAALGGQRTFFGKPLADLADQALARTSAALGRPLARIAWHGPAAARHVFVAQGSLAEAAEAAVDALGRERGESFAVLSVLWLRPFPGAEITQALRQADTVTVLERIDEALAESPPLARELNAIADTVDARLSSVVWGAGGQPVIADDLVWLGRRIRAAEPIPPSFNLGLAPPSARTEFPRKQARATAVARSFPELANSCGVGDDEIQRPDDAARVVELIVPAADADAELAVALASALAGSAHPNVRSQVSLDIEGIWHGRVCAARTSAVAGLFSRTVDVLLFDAPDLPAGRNPFERVVRGGLVVLGRRFGPDPSAALHPSWRAKILERELRLVWVDADASGLVQELERSQVDGLSGLVRVDAAAPTGTLLSDDARLPFVVRRIARNDTHYDNPARFWGEVVQPLSAGEAAAPSQDPYLTLGIVPPGTSTFHDGSPGRMQLPVLDPAACTGCGRCWTVCPDSALAPVAIGTQALLDAASRSAATSGPAAERLRRAHGHLGARADKLLADHSERLAPAAFRAAFAWLLPKLEVPPDELADVEAAFEATLAALSPLPLFGTAPLFDEPHAAAKGSGALLGIALNPQACKGCGGCVEACADDALSVARQTPDLVVAASAGWQVWETLPDTPGPTIAGATGRLGELSSALLSRHASMAIAGGDAAEPGSGARLALRLTLAVAEQALQSRHTALVEALAKLEKRGRDAMRDAVTNAIHVDDEALVAAALSAAPGGLRNADDVVQRLAQAGAVDRIDTARLESLARLVERVAESRSRFVYGANGLGRARMALVIADGLETDWALRYPYNPFSVPVAAAMAGDAPELAVGTQHGLLADAVVVARLAAHLETVIDAPRDIEARTAATEAMGWTGVAAPFDAAATPVVVVGGADALLRRGLSGLDEVLGLDLPIRVLILDELSTAQTADPLRLAMAHSNAFAASTSVAYPSHLTKVVRRAFAHAGPAVIHIHAPSPGRHGFATEWTVAQAQLATLSRMHPLAIWDPTAAGTFGEKLDITDNPSVRDDTVTDGAGRPIGVANWAMTERRFAGMADEVRTALEQRAQTRWKVLREIAGIATPFTGRARDEGAAAATNEAAQQAAAAQERARAELDSAVSTVRAEQAVDLRDRLLRLAGYTPPPAAPDPAEVQ